MPSPRWEGGIRIARHQLIAVELAGGRRRERLRRDHRRLIRRHLCIDAMAEIRPLRKRILNGDGARHGGLPRLQHATGDCRAEIDDPESTIETRSDRRALEILRGIENQPDRDKEVVRRRIRDLDIVRNGGVGPIRTHIQEVELDLRRKI